MEKDLEKSKAELVEFCKARNWHALLDNPRFLILAMAKLNTGSTIEEAVSEAESTLIYSGEA